MESETSERPVPCHLQMRGTCKVKRWLDFKSYGFLFNPDPADQRDIYIHAMKVPVRRGIGHRLIDGETVKVTYVQKPDGKLKATHIEFVAGVYEGISTPTTA